MSRQLLIPAAVLALVASIAVFTGCGGSDDPAGPPTGGGSLELNSGNLPTSRSYSHTFANNGSFPYHCNIHASMTASVTVAAAGLDSALVNIAGTAFSQTSVTIKTGGTVRWVNLDGSAHTVTSD
jgi:plastocyanin